jgi:magnesium chelatase subunit D
MTFPFSAVVGQDEVKLALLLNAMDPAVGGVLLRGHKGTAKSTLARALAALLPRGAPFVELPVAATEDRVVGTLDLAVALTGGGVRFRRGLLAEAHGGVLYVDEVNLLPDHLVDVLLDVAASGVNRVEREGVSHVHPARFVLVGSMNPEEGDLRPQFLDRFGLAAEVVTSVAADDRAEAVTRRLAFDADPSGFESRWLADELALSARLAAVRPGYLPADLVRAVSALCVSVGAEGLRADLVICRAAAALAGWEGRPTTSPRDVRRVAPMALAHRARRQPLDDRGLDQAALDQALDDALGHRETHDSPPGARAGEAGEDSEDEVASPGDVSPIRRLEVDRQRGTVAPSGRRSVVEGPRGRLVGDRAPGVDGPTSVAVGATVRAAAARRGASGAATGRVVAPADLREAVREHRAGNLIVVAVDASGSMGADRRMEAAKGAVMSLLIDAYQRRDRVALVTFREDSAEVALRPTGSVEVAKARLTSLPTGGRTPLAAGLLTALEVAGQPGPSGHRPLLVLITDGRATAGPPDRDPLEAALQAAAMVKRRRVSAVVIDAEDGPTRLGLAADLAEAMGARYLTVPDLSAPRLLAAVRDAQAPRPAG